MMPDCIPVEFDVGEFQTLNSVGGLHVEGAKRIRHDIERH